jgi:branched-chain amino acid transport system ATP-binding protein
VSAAAEPLLEVDGLEVRYGAVPAVRGVDLRVQRGEIVGVIGPNGAGKSTTLLAVMGAVAAARGDIRLEGRSIAGRRTEEIVRRGVALVPEGRHIFAGLTVDENLRLGLVGRRDPEGVEADLAGVHELFPVVHEFRDRQAGALSGGQ